MLSIGNKKYRNLQEQVAYNTECIKKLDDYLDGITIEDKLVVIETDSGTFSDEKLVILSGPLAFISNNSRVWMKDSETLTELVFKAIDIKATEVGGAYFNVGGSKIVINRETGAYNTSSDTIITTYSKPQIDSLLSEKANSSYVDSQLALKANLSGAGFSGPITAPSIIEDMSGYSITISDSTENLSLTNIYSSAVKNGNKLTCVFFLKLNRSGTVSPGYIDTKLTMHIPIEVANKIIPYTTSGLTNVVSNSTVKAFKSYNSYIELPYILLKYTGGNFVLNIYKVNDLELDTDYLLRIEQTFLLSNNLAQ